MNRNSPQKFHEVKKSTSELKMNASTSSNTRYIAVLVVVLIIVVIAGLWYNNNNKKYRKRRRDDDDDDCDTCDLGRKKAFAHAQRNFDAINLTYKDPQKAARMFADGFAIDGIQDGEFGTTVGRENIYQGALAYGTSGYETDQHVTTKLISWDPVEQVIWVNRTWTARVNNDTVFCTPAANNCNSPLTVPANTEYSQNDAVVFMLRKKPCGNYETFYYREFYDAGQTVLTGVYPPPDIIKECKKRCKKEAELGCKQ
jgi:hypothetical protein